MKLKLLIVSLIIFGCITCSKDTYNTTPKLEFESVNATVFPRQSQVIFKLQCTDKEGDVVDSIWIQRISKVSGCSTFNFIDSLPIPDFSPPRNVKAQFQFSYGYATILPPNLGGCTIGNNLSANDTCYFRFWMHDKAQHISDTVNSPDIVLLQQ